MYVVFIVGAVEMWTNYWKIINNAIYGGFIFILSINSAFQC